MVTTAIARNGLRALPQATTTLEVCITAKGATLCARSGQYPARSIPVEQAGEVVGFSASVKNVGQTTANDVWFSYGSADAARLENLGDLPPGQEVTRTWQEEVRPGPPPGMEVWIAACAAADNADDACAWLAPWIGTPPEHLPPIETTGMDWKILGLAALAVGALWFFNQYEFVRE